MPQIFKDVSHLNFHIFVDVGTKIIERDQSESWDIDAVNLDTIHHLLGQVEDGVLVRLH